METLNHFKHGGLRLMWVLHSWIGLSSNYLQPRPRWFNIMTLNHFEHGGLGLIWVLHFWIGLSPNYLQPRPCGSDKTILRTQCFHPKVNCVTNGKQNNFITIDYASNFKDIQTKKLISGRINFRI